MHRCIELAKLGAGAVAPNPMVGAVLVCDDCIIGEGYHRQYGQAHAEVNCINNVSEANKHLVEKSTLYVSLEPCSHFGKTPPCADLIIQKNIPSVVIACRDSFQQVDGRGIQKLQAAGVKVITPVLEREALEFNRRFFTFHNQHRPYVILKWAQTANGKIANGDYSRLFISNALTNRAVHHWRSNEASILIGTTTALNDDPVLTTRLWPGSNPVRLVIDKALKLPPSLHLFDGTVKTIVFNTIQQEDKGQVLLYKISGGKSFIAQIMEALYQLNIQSVLVEGGAKLLQSFIDENYWDEARVITNPDLIIDAGIPAPLLVNAEQVSGEKILTDTIHYYKNRYSGHNRF
ncbi:MAG: bifunctional diaminohydroxyphosphoribosylaminopyrimidine deaminase/5-amino-6-(5-phosphoribosylamino)uracil reductase RibD [Ferruginibacter sp.]|nr:bifunctional diaminohydroxyphosphoribosylaminopyrimidine deaminase/5-amino-6-(5-phosphoribosylamino)uracil reductase RibD [Ferruginibacter sp.]